MMKRSFALALAALFVTTAASAQIAPIDQNTNRLSIAFNGIVTNDVTNSVQIRQPDGSFVPFVGQVPDYPYKVGDQISISFNATVPTKDYYASPQYTGQQAADGIYRIALQGNLPNSVFYGSTQLADVSGPGRIDENPYSLRGLTVVFDSNANSYNLELPTGSWSLVPFDLPSYVYDPATGTLTSRGSSCFSVQCESAGLVFSGNQTDGSFGLGPNLRLPIGLSTEPSIAGFFDPLKISGSFNIPFFGSSGGDPTPVPEPSMIILFGAGAAAMMRRRKRAV